MTRVCIIYPADPAGDVPGGIDTFIRGEINNAPDDIHYSLIGISTDTSARPVGKWMNCRLSNGEFRFLPIIRHNFTDKAPIVPVTLRYLLRLNAAVRSVDADIIEFHRVEPMLRFRRDTRPKTAVLHQNMQSLYEKQADIRWASLPRLYFALEDRVMPDLSSAFCVRSDATDHYRQRYANLENTCWFQPTWADPRQFSPVTDADRQDIRQRLASEFGLRSDDRWLISVGRLDAQKDPLLMIEALRQLIGQGRNAVTLLVVGEGALRDDMTAAIARSNLADHVRFLGLRSADEVTNLLRAADLFVMSSAYEGMPMAVVEALACGTPVATTPAGEVARVVDDGVSGRITASRSPEELCAAIDWCLNNLAAISGQPSLASAARFSPDAVLQPIYENYRRLAGHD